MDMASKRSRNEESDSTVNREQVELQAENKQLGS
jgi:hypothetical protein